MRHQCDTSATATIGSDFPGGAIKGLRILDQPLSLHLLFHPSTSDPARATSILCQCFISLHAPAWMPLTRTLNHGFSPCSVVCVPSFRSSAIVIIDVLSRPCVVLFCLLGELALWFLFLSWCVAVRAFPSILSRCCDAGHFLVVPEQSISPNGWVVFILTDCCYVVLPLHRVHGHLDELVLLVVSPIFLVNSSMVMLFRCFLFLSRCVDVDH